MTGFNVGFGQMMVLLTGIMKSERNRLGGHSLDSGHLQSEWSAVGHMGLALETRV